VVDTAGAPVAGADVSVRTNGLLAEVFRFQEPLRALPSLSHRTPAVKTIVSAANLRNPQLVFGPDPFGFAPANSHVVRLTGYLTIERTGYYAFKFGVNGGGRLVVDDDRLMTVVPNGEFQERTRREVWLRAGTWPIEVTAFSNGETDMQLSYALPGESWQVVPTSMLTPAAALPGGRTGADGTFSIPGVPTVLGDITASAVGRVPGGRRVSGIAAPVAPVASDVTPAGDISVR
jgi:hypothetical protein